MLDVTEQLRRYADAVTDEVTPVPFAGVEAVATVPARVARKRGPVLVAAALVLVVVAVLGGIGWLALRSEDDPPPATDPSPPPSTEVRPGVTMLDPGPLEPRADAAVVWTGEELVVWGGDIEAFNMGLPGEDRAFADGAAYDPATRRWRRMSDSPLSASMDFVTAAPTTGGVVIVRGRETALWAPRTDTWRRLDDAPAGVGDLVATPGPNGPVFSATANALLEPETGTWRSAPPPPIALDGPVAAWTGSELLVVGQRTFYTPGAVAFDPDTSTWRELPGLDRLVGDGQRPALNPAATAVASDGDRLIFTDYEMNVVSYRREEDGSADVWTRLPPVPARFSESSPSITAAGDALVVTAPSAIAIRVGNSSWVPVPYDEIDFWSRAVATVGRQGGQDLLVLGMTPEGEMKLARVDPHRLASSERTLQVGVARIDLPEGSTLTDSTYSNPGIGGEVRIDLVTSSGACSVTSSYVSQTDAADRWVASDGGRTWVRAGTTSDVVLITCDDAATATKLKDATTVPEPSSLTGSV